MTQVLMCDNHFLNPVDPGNLLCTEPAGRHLCSEGQVGLTAADPRVRLGTGIHPIFLPILAKKAVASS
jgi:hypothetical protein